MVLFDMIMLKRQYLGVALFAAGVTLLFLSFDFKITGNAILNNSIGSSFGIILPIVFLATAMILMTSRVSLDAILIPCSNEEGLTRKRAKEAAKAHAKNPEAMIVASGGNTPGLNSQYASEAAIASEELEMAGIDPRYVKLETKARDTFDNVRKSLEKIPDARSIGIVSNRYQIARLEKIIKKGKKDGVIPQDLRVYPIKTSASFKEKMYEVLVAPLNEYVLRTQSYQNAKMPEGKLKKKANYMLKPGKKK